MSTGNVAIVTGAGNGIGFEIARQLVQQGDKVVLNDLHPGLCVDAADRLNKDFNGVCTPCPGDASDLATIVQMVDAASQLGDLTKCVANAGITSYGEFLECDLSQFDRLVTLNLKGSFFLLQTAAKQMIKQGNRGSMLLMSSVTGVLAHRHLAAYGMTKAALSMLAKALVPELARHGILVNAIAPGAVQTERTLQEDPLYGEKWGSVYPTGRTCYPSDIAKCAAFLLHEENEMINGQTIVVDGGWTTQGLVPTNLEFPTSD